MRRCRCAARWVLDRPVGNPARATNRFEVVSAERVSAALAPDRRPQVNSQSIVVVSETAAGRELDWRIVPDPRVVRAESAEGDKLTGDTLYYSTAELLLPAVHLPVWIDRHDGRGVPLRRRAQKAW